MKEEVSNIKEGVAQNSSALQTLHGNVDSVTASVNNLSSKADTTNQLLDDVIPGLEARVEKLEAEVLSTKAAISMTDSNESEEADLRERWWRLGG
ncbi:hypothetical protein L6452_06431 [Arctium lappa]|uniref:Uncharacterized protein n=1 Tax=Arctium lappa TaxID=4217 RepID=A0ACB9EIP0_ARCLA|nr:hypothetical protein L6452_06431 [Arctium lappa]